MSGRQRIAFRVLLLTMLMIATSQSLYGQGKLGRIRDKVRENKPTPEHREERSSRPDNDRDQVRQRERSRNRNRRAPQRRPKPNRNRRQNCNPGLELLVGGYFAAPAVETVHVVHHAPSPVIIDPVVAPIVEQPVISIVDVAEPIYQEVVVAQGPDVQYSESFAWGVRMSAIGATDFDDIVQGSFGLLLQAAGGLGIDTSVTMIRESGTSFRDHLFLGDVNLVYEPIFEDNFRLRLGIGVNWLGDSYGGDAGFNMTSGFDLKLTQRAIATGEIDFGSIGDTDIMHGRIGIGRKINSTTECVVGYDHLDIGGVTIGSAFTGLQFRF